VAAEVGASGEGRTTELLLALARDGERPPGRDALDRPPRRPPPHGLVRGRAPCRRFVRDRARRGRSGAGLALVLAARAAGHLALAGAAAALLAALRAGTITRAATPVPMSAAA
jgi:hypothetical protein